jgi:hypothetical protein
MRRPFTLIALAALWPVLSFVGLNFGRLAASDFTKLGIFLAAWTLLFVGITGLGRVLYRRWDWDRWGFVVAPFAILPFFYLYIGWGESTRIWLFAFACISAAIVLAKLSSRKVFRDAMTAVLVTGVLLSLVKILPQAAKRWRSDASELVVLETEPRVSSKGPQRNVYVLIADAYARADTLKKQFSFDNGPFVESLKALGFTNLPDSSSNYPMTFLSLASLFNMDYPLTEKEGQYNDRKRFHELIKGNNAFVNGLKKRGYRYAHMGLGVMSGTGCGRKWEDACVDDWFDRKGWFGEFFFSEVMIVFLDQTVFRDPLHRAWSKSQQSGFTDLRMLGSQIERLKSLEPHFTFAHTLFPHPPYRYDADCTLRPNAEFDLQHWNPEARPLYLNAIRCVNTMALETLQKIVELDPEAIVVFMSDHGPGFTSTWEAKYWKPGPLQERFANFLNIRAPEACQKWLYPSMTPVNVLRFVAGCLESEAPDYLQDRYYLSDYEREDPSVEKRKVRSVPRILGHRESPF